MSQYITLGPNAKDLSGKQFHDLFVLGPVDHTPDGRVKWLCRCICGTETIVRGKALQHGNTKSCGCRKHRPSHRRKDITNQRFGRLTALRADGKLTYGGVVWLCQCDCGNEVCVSYGHLHSGHTRSCGCLARESTIAASIKHGMKHTRLYGIWGNICQRCGNPTHKRHPDYGGRGIKFHEAWRDSFVAFYDYVSKLEHFDEPGYSLDRINNDGNYEPDNVRWATIKEQVNNARSNHMITYNEKTQSLAMWADELGVPARLLSGRFRLGWSIERALTTPRKKLNRKPK